MTFLSLGIFSIPLSMLVLFLFYKRVELFLGKEFGVSLFLKSQDEKIIRLLFSLKNFLRSCKGRVSSFVLNVFVYPLHRFSRRTKFKISSAYFRFLERLRQKHIARYNKNESSLYLKTISSSSVDEKGNKKIDLEDTQRKSK